MSATLENYFALTLRDGGSSGNFGSMRSAVGEATVDGTDLRPSRRISIGTEDYAVIWEQSHGHLTFQEVGFRIIGDGVLYVFVRTDLPTSASNYTPLGTRQRWRQENHNCKLGPYIRSAQAGISVASLTNEVADNAGVPRLMTTDLASAQTVIIDRIVAYNPSADDEVAIEIFAVD